MHERNYACGDWHLLQIKKYSLSTASISIVQTDETIFSMNYKNNKARPLLPVTESDLCIDDYPRRQRLSIFKALLIGIACLSALLFCTISYSHNVSYQMSKQHRTLTGVIDAILNRIRCLRATSSSSDSSDAKPYKKPKKREKLGPRIPLPSNIFT